MGWRLRDLVRALNPAQIYARLVARFPAVALSSGVAATLDSVVADSYQAAAWDVTLVKSGSTSQRRIYGRHNGTSGADATTTAMGDHGSEDVGTVDVALDVDVSGAGTSQVMRLRATASSSGWTAYVTRVPIKPTQP